MGQTDRFVERTTRLPPRVIRVFNIVMPIVMVVRAVESGHLADIVTAVWFVALLLPAGIAPNAWRARLAALDKRPVVGIVSMFVLVESASLVLLDPFMDATQSLLIALPVAVLLCLVAVVLRRRRT
jgi:hypothetical protein